ncbi:hypothetical protein [Bacillus cereus]|uniref:hypothetical protein n=1 Tax=Bacillus cereus TaxID=1396 RepID=UPI00211D5F60
MAYARAFDRVFGFKLKENGDLPEENNSGNNPGDLVPNSSNETGITYIEGTNVNLRKGTGKNYEVICKLQKG